MTGAEIIAFAQLQTEEDYDDATWVRYINACLDDLTPLVKVLARTDKVDLTADTDGSADIVLASDENLSKAHSILKVYFAPTDGDTAQLQRLMMSDNISRGWKLTSTKIIYQNLGESATGKTIVDYYKRLAHITDIKDDLETVAGLPAEYHSLVVLFCVAKCQQREEELDDANTAYAEYIAGKRQMHLNRMWEMEPNMRKHVKKARIASIIGGS